MFAGVSHCFDIAQCVQTPLTNRYLGPFFHEPCPAETWRQFVLLLSGRDKRCLKITSLAKCGFGCPRQSAPNERTTQRAVQVNTDTQTDKRNTGKENEQKMQKNKWCHADLFSGSPNSIGRIYETRTCPYLETYCVLYQYEKTSIAHQKVTLT